jgi:hypothetical protein
VSRTVKNIRWDNCFCMKAYIFGAGASVQAGYPLASRLLHRLSDWLDTNPGGEASAFWVQPCRNRMLQIRETFGSLDSLEAVLGKLEQYGTQRVTPTSTTTYEQDFKDIAHDVSEYMMGRGCRDLDDPAVGFYPQYLRSDLITAFREMFYSIEESRCGENAYDKLARTADAGSGFITFNYDVALERALAKAAKWDVGDGYWFNVFPDRKSSSSIVHKLHGSVNWFKSPIQEYGPPHFFPRDLKILGYEDLRDPSVGNRMPVDNSSTFILPDPNKTFYWECLWLPLWQSAADHLRATDEVFIYGYSMPAADARGRALIFDNVSKAARINVHCMGNSNRMAEEFRGQGFTNVSAFPEIGFEAWAESL